MKKQPLLPNYFKWIALILIIVNFLCFFAFRDSIITIGSEAKTIAIKEIIISIVNIGLLMLLFTKRSYDDEMLMFIRLVTICGGVFMIVIYVMVLSIINYIDNMVSNGFNSWMLFTMLLFVNSMFEWQCRRLKKQLNEE
ncbi:MAG: hypothetical protein LBI73_00405 [Myroides sp.]|jgi:hypothetical protein|nr:hypothetical protein [Myroides sp.]